MFSLCCKIIVDAKSSRLAAMLAPHNQPSQPLLMLVLLSAAASGTAAAFCSIDTNAVDAFVGRVAAAHSDPMFVLPRWA
jgi:hypothetical protein